GRVPRSIPFCHFRPIRMIHQLLWRNYPIPLQEANMPYKTIIIELLRQRPRLHAKLRRKRQLLAVVNQYARELKTRHEELKTNLSRRQPGIDPSQIASAAME